jgi:hypothetical protein
VLQDSVTVHKKGLILIMPETPEKQDTGPQEERQAIPQEGTSTRREMIQRYAKVAVAAAPLLLFVSKAHAIHSKP